MTQPIRRHRCPAVPSEAELSPIAARSDTGHCGSINYKVPRQPHRAAGEITTELVSARRARLYVDRRRARTNWLRIQVCCPRDIDMPRLWDALSASFYGLCVNVECGADAHRSHPARDHVDDECMEDSVPAFGRHVFELRGPAATAYPGYPGATIRRRQDYGY